MSKVLVALLCGAVLLGCGEPPVDVAIPQRPDTTAISDQAGILDTQAVESTIAQAAADGVDVVALTYETEQAGCGEAYRAATEFVAAWDADVAIVAVAEPGDFTSQAEDRQRCVGIQPRDPRGLPADLRERIAEEIVPPIAAENDWTRVFTAAISAVLS